ncbi:hypothetical protein THAOC_17415 [Thalassiosira oceanica]|uniref:Uncharacterized protein n=1 Tax=Thalassiosira oceanica TaxID=159749 RepID=K0SM33_THAOC|nr:hypothetical protein THAOC_17415 [Thalassiosira oceanica]|eukprot:EJK61996.1 hypothetical protein THAOC_17415 [Thalassiosira oceanica]
MKCCGRRGIATTNKNQQLSKAEIKSLVTKEAEKLVSQIKAASEAAGAAKVSVKKVANKLNSVITRNDLKTGGNKILRLYSLTARIGTASTTTATPCFHAEILESERATWHTSNPAGILYDAMDPLLAYTLAAMHLSAIYIHRGSGKTTWEPTSTSTSTATPCFRAEISSFKLPGTPQIQQV